MALAITLLIRILLECQVNILLKVTLQTQQHFHHEFHTLQVLQIYCDRMRIRRILFDKCCRCYLHVVYILSDEQYPFVWIFSSLRRRKHIVCDVRLYIHTHKHSQHNKHYRAIEAVAHSMFFVLMYWFCLCLCSCVCVCIYKRTSYAIVAWHAYNLFASPQWVFSSEWIFLRRETIVDGLLLCIV